MSARKKYTSFETAIARLEEITTALEAGDTSLDDAIALYTEGIEIARFCEQKLAEAQKKITMISAAQGAMTEQPFAADEDKA